MRFLFLRAEERVRGRGRNEYTHVFMGGDAKETEAIGRAIAVAVAISCDARQHGCSSP